MGMLRRRLVLALASLCAAIARRQVASSEWWTAQAEALRRRAG
jgi:hypothetical protein